MERRDEQVFLLSKIPYRASDFIVHLLSKEYGKLAAVAYGGQKPNSAKSFLFQPGERLEIVYKIFENRDFVQFESFEVFGQIQTDRFPYDRFLFHSYLLQLIQALCPENDPAPIPFQMLEENLSLSWAEKGRGAGFMAWSLGKIIEHGGMAINYRYCSKCQRPSFKEGNEGEPAFRKMNYRIEVSDGGVLCQDCGGFSSGNLDGAMIKLLWLIEMGEKFEGFPHPLPSSIANRFTRVLNSYLLGRFEIEPKGVDLFLSILDG